MKALSFLFALFALLNNALANESEPPLTEEIAAGVRAMMGIEDLAKEADADYFAFRDDGKFLVSKATFSGPTQAAAFCASKPGYHLTEGMLPGVLGMMNLPFVNLREQMVISDPVLGQSGRRTGVVAWISMDLSKIPPGQKLRPEEKETISLIEKGDFLLAFLDGDSGNGSGFHALSAVNARLAELGKKPLALSAICVDEQLRSTDSWLK
jgi:hypothetical protein